MTLVDVVEIVVHALAGLSSVCLLYALHLKRKLRHEREIAAGLRWMNLQMRIRAGEEAERQEWSEYL